MIPIYEERPRGERGYSYAEFRERFLEICAEHRNAGRALAFAFLMFDVDSPEVIKMLRDADYWGALHKISGKYLSVFTLVAHQPRESHRVENRMMVAVGPAAADPGMKIQLILRSYFGIDEKLKLPAMLFFAVAKGRVSGYSLIQLEAGGVEATFNEIRGLLQDTAAVLAKLKPGTRALDAVKNRLRRRKAVKLISDGTKFLDNVKDIAGLATMLG